MGRGLGVGEDMESQREHPQELVIMCGLSERHCPSESGFFLVALEGSSRTKVGMLQEGRF